MSSLGCWPRCADEELVGTVLLVDAVFGKSRHYRIDPHSNNSPSRRTTQIANAILATSLCPCVPVCGRLFTVLCRVPLHGPCRGLEDLFLSAVVHGFVGRTSVARKGRPHRVVALGVGFLGVIIAMNPTSGQFKWMAILPLLYAISYAVSQILARQIGERESTLTMSLCTIAFGGWLIVPFGPVLDLYFCIGKELPHLRWKWFIPTWDEFVLLLPLGLVGMAGYLSLSRAYQVASASLVAPFDYVYLPAAAILAYLVWNETPCQSTIVGMMLFLSSGLYFGYREIRNAGDAQDAPAVAEAVFVPNNPMPSTAPLEEMSELQLHPAMD